MLKNLSVKSLYAPALAEGEGVGTAYEYYTKRLAIRKFLKARSAPKTILIAGLPQKYGTSLDFFQLAAELRSKLIIIDDRPEHLQKAENALQAIQDQGWMQGLSYNFQESPLDSWPDFGETINLAVSSEVIQRLTPADRLNYLKQHQQHAQHTAIFSPNKHNASHVGVSGLDGMTKGQLLTLIQPLAHPDSLVSGLIDMPPFPPGITRTDDQREQAESGRLEAIAMWGLQAYAHAEMLLPESIKRPYAHIAYAFYTSKPPH